MKKLLILALAAFLSVPLAACSQVDTGHRGVLVNFGKPTDVVGEGMAFYNPITYDMVQVDVRTIPWESQTEAYTRDIQQATVKFKLTYHLDPSRVLQIYQSVGVDWAATLIPQVVQQEIKNVMGQARAVEDAINNRQMVTSKINAVITSRLLKKGVIVDGFEIQDISFTRAFEEAVERKQVAIQNAETARNETVQIEEKARQTVLTAKGEAEAMQVKTAALAGSPKLVEYEAVQKWNGVLPQQMYGGNIPFIKSIQ